jgi:hypothetical protein
LAPAVLNDKGADESHRDDKPVAAEVNIEKVIAAIWLKLDKVV